MSNFNPDDFEKILEHIKKIISDLIECDNIKSIESNFNTKGMKFKSKCSTNKDGMIIVGEDNGLIAVDISTNDAIRNFILKNQFDTEGINNIVGWFKANYKFEKSIR
jgi:hypothetical protein